MIANFLRLTAPWVAGSSPLPSRHIRGSGWLEIWKCPFDCRMRHKVPNLQSIYLLKMYRNPFTLFLIAGEAHAKCRYYAILAILPFVTLLIAKDEAQSAELVQAILLSYFFRVFSWIFLPSRSLSYLSAVVHQSVTSYFFPIYYSTLVYYQIYTLVFTPAFLGFFFV